MRLELAPAVYGQPRYGLPESRLVNLYTRETPAGPGATARYPRPGAVRDYSVGVGPVLGFFQADGVFDGDKFTVSGGGLYREQALVDTVNRTGSRGARFASSSDQVVVVSGRTEYCYDGTTLSPVAVPDEQPVSDVAYLSGRFYSQIADSDRIYFSAVGDATSIDGLAFETAESAPDATVGLQVLGDELWAFGAATVEPLAQTGNANAPLARTLGRVIRVGCAAQATIVSLGNLGVLWVAPDRAVYKQDGTAVSTSGISTRLKRCNDITACTAWEWVVEEHRWYVLRIPGQGVFAYDVTTPGWFELTSYGRSIFRGRIGQMVAGVPYMGDDTDGSVFHMDPSVYTDDGDPIERIASAFVPLEQSGPCNNVRLQGARGVGSEAGSDPQVEMRFSDDEGQDWSDWDAQPLGKVGVRDEPPMWWGLGQMAAPGRAFEFRTTADCLTTWSYAEMNVKR